MKRKRRSTILIGTLLCAFSLLLAACGNRNQALKLDYKATKPQTPGATMTSTVAGSPGAQTTPGTQATATSTVEATPTAGGQGRLTAHLTQNAAIGTATLSNGKSFPFTANAITDTNSKSGLYYSTETINNTKYIAGWIIPPNAAPSGTATPGAT